MGQLSQNTNYSLKRPRFNSPWWKVFAQFTIHSRATLYLRYSDWRAELNIPLNLVQRLITYEWSMCFHAPIRLQGVTLNDRGKLTFLCFVDPASLHNFVNKANLVHNVVLIYLSIFTCFGRLCAHRQGKQLCLCDTWYLLFCVDDCLVFHPAYQTVIHTE